MKPFASLEEQAPTAFDVNFTRIYVLTKIVFMFQRPQRVPGGGVAARPARVVRARVHDLPPVQAHRAPAAHAKHAPPANGTGNRIN